MFADELGSKNVMLTPHRDVTTVALRTDYFEIKKNTARSSGNGMTCLEPLRGCADPTCVTLGDSSIVSGLAANEPGENFPGFLFETRQSGQAFSFLPSFFPARAWSHTYVLPVRIR